MKYLIRSCKYLVYFAVIFLGIVSIVWLLTIRKQGSVAFADLFQEGAFPKLALFFIAVAAVYPAISFITRTLRTGTPLSADKKRIEKLMNEAGYEIETDEGTRMTFLLQRPGMRFSRMYEDRITLEERSETTLALEGYRRDVERLVRFLHFKLHEDSAGEIPS